MLDDPFEIATPKSARDEIIMGGRYRLPNLDGSHKPYGWQRVSNLVSAFSDQYALRLWELGEVLAGVAASDEVRAALLEAAPQTLSAADRRAWTERFIEQAKDASGANKAAKHGTARHAQVEGLHAGLPTAHHSSGTRKALAMYSAALERHGLRALPHMQERRVLVEELEACGTLDNVLQTTGADPTWWIADLKTQRKFWTWMEISAQLACYAHGDAVWNPVLGEWTPMPKVSQEVALVLWLPRPEDEAGEPEVHVYEVDIVAGWRRAKLARQIVQERSSGKHGAALRPAPQATETERWGARFAALDSLADGRKLVAAAKAAGVWDETLAQSARAAAERLTVAP